MKIDELVVSLYGIREFANGSRSTEEIYRSAFGNPESYEDICRNLASSNSNTERDIVKLLTTSAKKLSTARLSDPKRLILIFRAEGAIAVLTRLLQAQSESLDVRLVIDSPMHSEVTWAMTSLWEPFSNDHLAQAACNIARGKWSLLD